MHWVIQRDLNYEQGYLDLVKVIERAQIQYSVVAVAPSSSELIPDPEIQNPIAVCGSVALVRLAKQRGWSPGVFYNEQTLHFEAWRDHLGDHLLNHDSEIVTFGDAHFDGEKFLRPCEDTKSFTGTVMSWNEFSDWRTRVVQADSGNRTRSRIDPQTKIAIAEPKVILREYRFFVVEGRVITGSQYVIGGRVVYDRNVDPDIHAYVEQRVAQWQPDKGFVIDIALTVSGPKVVEFNCLNSAAFYACDVSAIVQAVDEVVD